MINANLKSTYAADERVLNNRYKQFFVYGMALLLAVFGAFANKLVWCRGCYLASIDNGCCCLSRFTPSR